MSTSRPDLSRREFIRLATVAAGAFALGGCTDNGPYLTAICDPSDGAPCLPTLGGAPDTNEGRVIAAFVDTVVPGKHRDPTGRPGAIDAGAPALFFDPALPAAPFVPLLVLYLDGKSRGTMGGRGFAELLPAERETVLAATIVDFPPVGFAVQLAKLAFYSSREAGDVLGYPGPNAGYWRDPDFSFGVALTTEITDDGNLP